jgi:hypothetical protein
MRRWDLNKIEEAFAAAATGPSGCKNGIVAPRHAFDNQTHGTRAEIRKLTGMALIPLENSAMRSANFIEIESAPFLDDHRHPNFIFLTRPFSLGIGHLPPRLA